ncbi:MAG: hypothetical protein HWE07_05015 [Cytophagia bacterium]|nr:hypothetical protein [Cytophagia bacterium]
MNSETLLKFQPKKTQMAGKGHLSYFVVGNRYSNPEVIFFNLGPINVVGQDFKSTSGLKDTILERQVEETIEKAKVLGIDSPGKDTLELSSLVFMKLKNQDFSIDFINPSREGGVILESSKDGTYYLFEFFNDGDIVFLKRNGQNREVFDLDKRGLLEAIEKI